MIGSWLSMQNVIAVESMTCRRRFSTSKWRDLVELHRGGITARVGAVDAVDAGVRALEDRSGADLGGPQRGGGVGREVRVAGPGGEHDHPALLEVADGPPRDVGLGDLGHRDRGLHARRLPDAFQRVLQARAR